MEPNRTERKPIKRSEYIAVLSRDHHAGLLFCWKIKEGLKNGIDLQRINQYVKYFWEGHLQEHFREEEILLFSKLDDELTNRAKRDHQVLAGWFMRIIESKVEYFQDYFSFTELLVNHIRFEERVLFPFMEEHLPAAVLEEIGEVLAGNHTIAFDDHYPDEFWVKQK
jgi:hemerythrin-like domain-containing protein